MVSLPIYNCGKEPEMMRKGPGRVESGSVETGTIGGDFMGQEAGDIRKVGSGTAFKLI